jgi:hypothetical protein
MAVCLQYQAVHVRRKVHSILSWKIYALMGVVVVSAFLLKVRSQIDLMSLGYELHAAESDAMELDRERGDLEYQLLVVSTHDFIRAEAKSRLRIDETNPHQVHKVGSR